MGRKHKGVTRAGGYGGRVLTPNADRCLRQSWRFLRCAWESFRAAVRWQIWGA